MLAGLILFLWFSRGRFPIFVKPIEKKGNAGLKSSVWHDPGVRLVLVMVFFTAIYMIGQQTYGGVMNLYVRDRVDKIVLGFDIPTTWFLSLNPLIIVLGGPSVSKYWARHDQTAYRLPAIGKNPDRYYVDGFVLRSVGSCRSGGWQGPGCANMDSRLLSDHNFGRALLFPIGLAEISRHAPQSVIGILMGLWVFTMGFGSLGAGWLGGTFADAPSWVLFAVLAAGGSLSAAVLWLT